MSEEGCKEINYTGRNHYNGRGDISDLNRPNWDMPPLVFRPLKSFLALISFSSKYQYIHDLVEPRLAFISFVYQGICPFMSAALSNSNFNLALGYKQHSIEGSTRRNQHSSLNRTSRIHPFHFHRMSHHVSFHPKLTGKSKNIHSLMWLPPKTPQIC